MCGCDRRHFMGAALGLMGSLALTGAATAAQDGKPKVYTCPPCGCPNDGKEFSAPGPCTVCEMPLMEKPAAPVGGQTPASPPARPPAAPAAATGATSAPSRGAPPAE